MDFKQITHTTRNIIKTDFEEMPQIILEIPSQIDWEYSLWSMINYQHQVTSNEMSWYSIGVT